MDTKRMAAYFARVQKHASGQPPMFTGGLGWIDSNGNARVSDRYPNGSGSNVTDRAYFKAVMTTGKPYISEGLFTKVGQRRVVIMAVPTRDAAGKLSGALIGALQVRQSGTSQRANDLGFEDLIVIDRAGQQLTLRSFAKPENASLLSRIRKGDGVLGDTTGLNGDGDRAVAFANSAAPRWTLALDRPRSSVLAAARRSFVIEMLSILVAAVIVLGIVGWAISRSRREIAAEQEQVRRWDELTQSLGAAEAADEVSTALGTSLATAFPRAHVIVALPDDDTGRFSVWTFGGGDAGPIDRRTAGLAEVARLAYLSRSPLRITQPAAVGTVLSQVTGRLTPEPASIYGLPMHSDAGRTIGSVTLLLPQDEVLHDTDEALVAAHTDYAARALSRARHSEREHDVATALQRSLLPTELPEVEGVGLAGRYNAGAVGLEVGGDWYDAVRRPDGVVHFTVGDVAGRGVSAAVLMGQLRNSFRALAYEHTSPAEIARRLTRLVPENGMATATFLALDPYTGELRYSTAGHPPPLLLDAVSGEVTLLDEASAPPLGWIGTNTIREARLTLRSRMTLLAYTDGLVERRGLNIDDGIERAADTLRLRPERGAEDTADALLETFVQPTDASDDIALFVLQLDDVPATFQVEIPADPLIVRGLRGRLKAWLARRGLNDEQTADTVLAVSEACNNAIEHGYAGEHGTIRITLEHQAGVLRITVEDDGTWKAVRSDPARGRGMLIMNRTMDSATVASDPNGTRVDLELHLS
jgi:serine phosphatase RsbU (regulator of sigma subunit)/anti-sigma regulatory factor (Ser/Thr protein kinase)